MSNITATSSAAPPPIKAHLRPTAGPLEDAARQAKNISDPTMPSDLAPATSEASPTKATAPTTKVQDAKARDAKAQDAKALAEAVGELNERFKSLSRTNLQFTIDEKADRVVVKVIDAEKDEVIRQIPPEDTLKLAASLKDKINMEAEKLQQVVLAAANKPSAEVSLDSLLLRDQA